MSETDQFSSAFPAFSGPRYWKVWAFAAFVTLIAATGTWIGGQYKIGRLDVLRDRYDQPIVDYARTVTKAQPNSIEFDLLESCKQAQIGSWLQTTDALTFLDPASGNRVAVRLDPGKSFIDLNGRELAGCIGDEIEDRQFDIGSMTNTWSLVLFIFGLGLAGWSWLGWEAWRKSVAKASAVTVLMPEDITPLAPESKDDPKDAAAPDKPAAD